MAETKIMSCNCKHEDQDSLHGKGKRVFNVKTTGGYNCTACGIFKRDGDFVKKPKK